MNVNPRILAIGSSMNIPTYPDVMRPSEGGAYPDKYIVFLYSDERPILRGTRPIAEAATIQVHLFTNSSPITDKETLKQKLTDQGFVIQSIAQYHEDDTGYTHLIITVWDWDTFTEASNE